MNKCTPGCMVYGETGRGVILNHIKCRMIGFWLRLVKGKETKHSCTILKFLLHLQGDIHSPSKSQWLSFMAMCFELATRSVTSPDSENFAPLELQDSLT